MQKRPKRCCPGVRAQLLVGELDLNGLIGAFELNSLAHRLVSRAFAHTWLVFLHKNNQPTNGGLNSTALLRLRPSRVSPGSRLAPPVTRERDRFPLPHPLSQVQLWRGTHQILPLGEGTSLRKVCPAC